MMSRASCTIGLIVTLVLLVLLPTSAVAQTAPVLTSITVTAPGLSGTPMTGSFATLVATGSYSDGSSNPVANVTWSSASPAIAVSSTGVAQFQTGTLPGVVVTATSGSISGSITFKVMPQTTLFASDGEGVDVYDITLLRTPTLLTNVPLGASGQNNASIPMVLSPTGTHLYVANPAYVNPGTYGIYAINTSTLVVDAQVTTTCRPTGLAAKDNFLFVVASATCSGNGNNVIAYDTTQNLTQVAIFSARELAANNPNAIPLVAGASIDPDDHTVYIGSTASYSGTNCDVSCIGTLTTISTSGTVPTVQTSTELNSGTDANGYSIAPLGLTVATSYVATSTTGPIHTVFLVGPGFNSTASTGTNPPSTSGMYFQTIYGDSCANVCPVTPPQQLFLENGPAAYVPIPTSVSPDGLTIYTSDGGNFVDSVLSSDGRNYGLQSYFSTGGAATCSSACQALYGLAITADGQHLFAGFSSQINRLTPALASDNVTTVTNHPYALAVTQAPELSAFVQSQNGNTLVTGVTMHGNFEDPYAQPGYGVNITDSQGNNVGNSSGSIRDTVTTYSVTPITSTNVTTGATTLSANVSGGITNLSGSFLGVTTVGPVAVTIPPLTVNAVSIGSGTPIVANVVNGVPNTVTWSASLGQFASPFDSASGAPILYTAPTDLNANPTTVTLTATSDVVGCSGTGCSATYTISVVAPTVTATPASLTFASQTIGTTSAVQTITLANTSTVPLTTSGITLSGTNVADFMLGPIQCGASLAAGASCTIGVTFTPAAGAVGSRAAIVSITDNALNSPQSVGLSGTAGAPPIISVAVAPATATLNVGATQQFTATVQGTTSQAVTWQVAGVTGGNSSVGTITAAGLYTAPAVLPPVNPFQVQAVSVADPTSSSAAVVTLVAPITVSVSPAAASTLVGAAQNFTATVLPANTTGGVTWSLSGNGCTASTCGTLSNITTTTVTFTANASLTAAATAVLTATSVADPTKSVTASVSVYLPPILTTTPTPVTTAPGGTATYTLTLGAGTGDPSQPLTIQCDPQYLPTGVTCAPITIQPGQGPQTFTLTLITSAPQSTSLERAIDRSLTLASGAVFFPFGMLIAGRRRRSARVVARTMFCLLLLLAPAGLLTLDGCGTNGSFNQAPAKSFGATPAGTFTIHIDAVGAGGFLKEIGQVTLVVS